MRLITSSVLALGLRHFFLKQCPVEEHQRELDGEDDVAAESEARDRRFRGAATP
jgi:hypothetical protein